MNSLTKLITTTVRTPIRNVLVANQVKYSYKSSPFVCDLTPTVKYDVSKDPKEWVFVERILPPITVPTPELKDVYPSNWKPQQQAALEQPYFVKRTRNYMLPVYLETTYRGMRHLTRIRLIDGDIWQMEQDLKNFLQPMCKKPIRVQVHEFAGNILIHGDHVNAIKHWLQEKQF